MNTSSLLRDRTCFQARAITPSGTLPSAVRIRTARLFKTFIEADRKIAGPAFFYNPCVFEIPPPGTVGNLGRNTIFGPSVVNLDLSLQRDFGRVKTLVSSSGPKYLTWQTIPTSAPPPPVPGRSVLAAHASIAPSVSSLYLHHFAPDSARARAFLLAVSQTGRPQPDGRSPCRSRQMEKCCHPDSFQLTS